MNKRLFSILTFLCFLAYSSFLFCQDSVLSDSMTSDSMVTDSLLKDSNVNELVDNQDLLVTESNQNFHQVLKENLLKVEPVLCCFDCTYFRFSLCIERIIYLSATTDTDKLLSDIDNALNTGNVESAKEVCKYPRTCSFNILSRP